MKIYRLNGFAALLGLVIFLVLLFIVINFIIIALPILIVLSIVAYLFRRAIFRRVFKSTKKEKKTGIDKGTIDAEFKVK